MAPMKSWPISETKASEVKVVVWAAIENRLKAMLETRGEEYQVSGGPGKQS